MKNLKGFYTAQESKRGTSNLLDETIYLTVFYLK